MTTDLSSRIKAARKARGLTQKEVAERLGVKTPNVGEYERGLRDARLSTIQRFAAAIGCPLSELIGETEQSPTELTGYRKSVCCDGHVTIWTPIKEEEK